jgi:hypothetical protein
MIQGYSSAISVPFLKKEEMAQSPYLHPDFVEKIN